MNRRYLCALAWLTVLALAASVTYAQCPEDLIDNGICDTLYVKVWDADTLFAGDPWVVRVPMYVTHDVPDPLADSISGLVVPVCYTHTNSAAYCSLPGWRNTASMLWVLCDFTCRSIFRDLPCNSYPEVHNRMLHMNEDGVSGWDCVFLDLGDQVSQFFLSMVPCGSTDQRWWEGSRVLLATMTFQVEDTMTVCIDSCFWPPSSHLAFSNAVAQTYVPRSNLPYYFSMTCAARGDCNFDCKIDLEDIVVLLNYLFKGGSAPPTSYAGDANSDGVVDLGDLVFLLGYTFKGGAPPGGVLPSPC